MLTENEKRRRRRSVKNVVGLRVYDNNKRLQPRSYMQQANNEWNT